MGQLCKVVLLMLVLTAMLHDTSGAKKGSSSKNTSKKTYSSQGTKSHSDPPRKQNPGRVGTNPGGDHSQYPAGGGRYPVRTAEDPGGYPVGGGYPNWNPKNNILSPRYGGTYRAGGFGTGGSPFSHSVQSMGYGPSVKSKGFAKQAMVAAGAGALAGMAVGYGVGQFPRPNFHFKSPQEEYYYNNYMYKHHDINSANKNDKNRHKMVQTQKVQTHKVQTQDQTYDQHMNTCMERTDLIKEQDTFDFADHSNIQRDEPLTGHTGPDQTNTTSSPTTNNPHLMDAGIREDENDDTVSILEIGYPALTEQMKARKCIEMYLVNMEKNSSNRHSVCGLFLLLTTFTHVLPSWI